MRYITLKSKKRIVENDKISNKLQKKDFISNTTQIVIENYQYELLKYINASLNKILTRI